MSVRVDVRPLAPKDVEAVRRLVLNIQNGEFGVPITLEAQPDLVDPAGFFRQGAGEVWVADLAGEVVGIIALVDIGAGVTGRDGAGRDGAGRDGALRKMFVRADARGAGLGVACRRAFRSWGSIPASTGSTSRIGAGHRPGTARRRARPLVRLANWVSFRRNAGVTGGSGEERRT